MSCYAQASDINLNRFEFGVGIGTTFIMPNYRKNDAVDRDLILDLSTKYGSGDLLRVEGSNVLSHNFTCNYIINKNSFVQVLWDVRYRQFVFRGNSVLVNQNQNDDLEFQFYDDISYWKGYVGYFSFTQRSINIPLNYQRMFSFTNNKSWKINYGIGLGYYTSIRNQVIRKSPLEYESGREYPIDSETFTTTVKSNFIYAQSKIFNGHFNINYSVGIRKEFKCKNKLELNFMFIDNFKTTNYYDKLEVSINPRIQTIGTNPLVVEQFPISSKKMSLQQGGLMISLRYYPKPFNVNTNGVN